MAARIEVRDAEQKCYIPAKLIDMLGEKYQVQLGSDENTKRWVRWELISEESEATDFTVKQDSVVEVLCTDDGSAWYDADVKSIKGAFHVVQFCGSGKEEIVEKERMRPARGAQQQRTKPLFVKQLFPLRDPKMHDWFLQPEGQAALQETCAKARVLTLAVDPKTPQIRMLGTEKALHMAKILLDLHGRHIETLLAARKTREELASRMSSEQEKLGSGCRLDFPIERELIGLVVGKNGKQIRETKKATGVYTIEIDEKQVRVVVIGPTQESIEAAREMLEFVSEKVPVESSQVGWLIGRNGNNFKELQDKTKVTRLNVDKQKNEVVLVGTKTAVEAARLYIETHLTYLTNFENEERESQKLRQEIRSMSLEDEEPTGFQARDIRNDERTSERTAGRGRGGGRGRGAPTTGGCGSLAASAGVGAKGVARDTTRDQTQRNVAAQRNCVAASAAAESNDVEHADVPRGKGDAGGRGGAAGRGRGGRAPRPAPRAPAAARTGSASSTAAAALPTPIDTISPGVPDNATNGSVPNGSSLPQRTVSRRAAGRGRGGARGNGASNTVEGSA